MRNDPETAATLTIGLAVRGIRCHDPYSKWFGASAQFTRHVDIKMPTVRCSCHFGAGRIQRSIPFLRTPHFAVGIHIFDGSDRID